MLPNAGLFSITRFLNSLQNIFMNKKIFSKYDLQVLFILFFSKTDNKKLLFLIERSPIEQMFQYFDIFWWHQSLSTIYFYVYMESCNSLMKYFFYFRLNKVNKLFDCSITIFTVHNEGYVHKAEETAS